jgi:hypothetical protein
MEAPIIVDVEATPTRISKEVEAAETMVERTKERFELKPDRMAGDVAYGTGGLLGWLVDRKIDPHIPVWDRSERDDGTFSRADFTYDKDNNLYICPGGKSLKTTGRVHGGRTIYYRTSKRDCEACPLKPHCCPKTPQRRISRDVDQDARDYAQALMATEAYETSREERKKIETLFAEVKHILSRMRLRLRGLSGARDEFLLIATVQNLKRLAQHSAIPPPQPSTA